MYKIVIALCLFLTSCTTLEYRSPDGTYARYSYTGDKQIQAVKVHKKGDEILVEVNDLESKQMEVDGIITGVVEGLRLIK